MRIVAGKFRSRKLKAVEGNETRPTLDKVKEAVFSKIGPYFDGGEMLDLFGGSGNIGLEAISRGMEHVTFCDISGKAIMTMKENIATLQVQNQCTVVKAQAMSYLKSCGEQHKQFDLIYMDPPYKKQQIHKMLCYINENNLCRTHAYVICESLKEDCFDDNYGSLEKIKDVIYGITRITYFRKED